MALLLAKILFFPNIQKSHILIWTWHSRNIHSFFIEGFSYEPLPFEYSFPNYNIGDDEGCQCGKLELTKPTSKASHLSRDWF